MCASMRPGTTVRPARSMTRRCPPDDAGAAPTEAIRPSRIVTAFATVFRASMVWMRPFTRASSGPAPEPGDGGWPDDPAGPPAVPASGIHPAAAAARPAPAAVLVRRRRDNVGEFGTAVSLLS